MIEKLYNIFKNSKGVSIDTRENVENKIFFAIKGKNFDANNFLPEAEKKKAIALVGNIDYKTSLPYFKVNDTIKTLQLLANYHRKKLKTKIVAVGGSNGKTTTKELLYSILKIKYNVFKSPGNYNNHIGVPLSLLQVTNEYDYAILEFGDNHVGELKTLCNIALPNDAIITNVGKDHLGEFNSLEANYNTKYELINFIKKNNGTLILFGDDIFLKIPNKNYNKSYFFGTNNDNDIIANIDFPNIVKLKYKGKKYNFSSKLLGIHNALNIASATLYGVLQNILVEDIIKIVENFNPYKNRGELIEKNGIKIYLDAYNANPSSMEAMLNYWFSGYPAEKIGLILGEMAELGKFSEREHKKLGEKLLSLSPNFIILVGNDSIYTFNVLKNNYNCVYYFKNVEEIPTNLLQDLIKNINFLLIKGSRINELEKVLSKI